MFYSNATGKIGESLIFDQRVPNFYSLFLKDDTRLGRLSCSLVKVNNEKFDL